VKVPQNRSTAGFESCSVSINTKQLSIVDSTDFDAEITHKNLSGWVLVLRSPAKVNLFLRVIKRWAD
jgi:hypothetical protein